ncbi:dienelactone hydrolase [Mesorhizobium sp. B3-1-6]|uniref:alpha/beta hydrolase family protein n=1 Tax=Mesorhizobium sp. B3-1-6 TaxID=2589895 RepID=UPI00112AC52A|nr:dienelactone hydrolase [Mesorhizobium sp. B3-1-6]TPI34711.1 dienelactone hydrolase [Mesorhizobium sp. B3-1-6]
MNHPRFLLAAMLSLAASLGHAAGLKFVHIADDADGPAIDAAVWSPCAEAPQKVKVKGTTVSAVLDCPIAAEKMPLIVISHGYGGWYLGHHDTAEALADAGFMVVAINHPHANHADMSEANGLKPLRRRPADIKRTIDFMLGAFPDAAGIDAQRIGFYGFSQGGYTGLVIGGANPDFNKLPPRCADPKAVNCPPPTSQVQTAGHSLPAESLTHDARIKAIVVADPLSVVFQTADSVKDVQVPLQLWASQLGGGAGASPKDIATLAGLLPARPDFRTVPNAVHFSFLTPCPPQSRNDACVDAPGFDRAAFHKAFNAEVLAFFRKHLMDRKQSQ